MSFLYRDMVASILGLVLQLGILVISIATGKDGVIISTSLVMTIIILFSIKMIYGQGFVNKKIFIDKE